MIQLSRSFVIVCLVLLVPAVQPPGTAQGEIESVELTIEVPAEALPHVEVSFSGKLSAGPAGIPGEHVHVYADEQWILTARTNAYGEFYFRYAFDTPGRSVVIQAKAFKSPLLEVRSENHTLLVHEVILSLSGPRTTGVGVPTDYIGRITLSGIRPFPNQQISIGIPNQAYTQRTSNATGHFAFSYSFKKIEQTPIHLVTTWGLGRATAVLTIHVQVEPRITDLAVGSAHTCASLWEGKVKCWGDGYYGQLGIGSVQQARSLPTEVPGLADVVDVDLGGDNSCSRHSDLTVSCWGRTYTAKPVKRGGVAGAMSISVRQHHACAVITDGTVSCWGSNYYGALGDGGWQDRWNPPAKAAGLTNASAVAAGQKHTCALKTDGSVWCWGKNNEGQLGNGDSGDRRVPVQVRGLNDAIAISAGNRHTCALKVTGSIVCWGKNDYGQLGDGTKTNRYAPVAVTGIAGANLLATGDSHSCARISTGLMCWGRADGRQLGQNPTKAGSLALDGDGGYGHTCIRNRLDTISCWGYNEDGQLGDGTETTRVFPVQVKIY